MGANRLATPKRPYPTSVWSVTHPPSLACVARPTGSLDFFSFPTGRRPTLKAPRLSLTVGRPTSLSLRPTCAPVTYPLTVVGTHTGDILLDDTVITNVGAAPVLATHYHINLIVAVGGPNKDVVLIDPARKKIIRTFSMQTHHISPITSIVMPDEGRAMFCSQAMTLIDLETGNLLARYTGHQTAVTAAFSFDIAAVPYVATASDEPYVSIWRVDNPMNKKSQGQDEGAKRRRTMRMNRPVVTLAAPESGVHALTVDASNDTSVSVAAAMQNGNICVWRNCKIQVGKVSQPSSIPKPATFTVRGSGDAFVVAFPKNGDLAILYGNHLKPVGHTITMSEVRESSDVILPQADFNVIIGEVQGIHENANLRLIGDTTRLHVNGAFPAGITEETAKRKNGIVHSDDDDDTADILPNGSQEVTDLAGKGTAEDVKDTDSDDLGEPSIQDQLATLGIAVEEADAALVKSKVPSVLDETRLDSRLSVLLQAIRSTDSQQLESCLRNVSDVSVIRNTVSRLPSHIASGALLEMLVARLYKQPRNVEVIGKWIREILMEHAGSIITQRRNEVIASLSAVIHTRTKALDSLTKLQGRLELIVCQSERIQNVRAGLRSDAVAEYVEESDGESSGEDDSSSSSDEGSDNDADEGIKGKRPMASDDVIEVDDSDSDDEVEMVDVKEDSKDSKKNSKKVVKATGIGNKKDVGARKGEHEHMNGKMKDDGKDSSDESESESESE